MELPIAKDKEETVLVLIPVGLQEKIVAEFVNDGQHKEIAWGLFGRIVDKEFVIFCAARCEKSEAPLHVEIDTEKLRRAAENLEAYGDIDFLGLLHSHPQGNGFPATQVPGPSDHQADMAWLKENDIAEGIFGIISSLGTTVKLNWYILNQRIGMYADAPLKHITGTTWENWQKEADK